MNKHQLFFYGWNIVAVGIVIQSLGYTTRYSFSVIFPALLDDFQWARDVTAIMLSVNLLVYGVVAPIAGGLVDSIGPRKTMLSGATLLASGLALSAWASEPWHFYLSFGVLTAVGLCFMGTVPFTSVLRNWFDRKRGLAFSLMFLGTGGAFASYPAIAFMIDSAGWRNTFLLETAAVVVITLPLIAIFVRYHPREKNLISDGLEAKKTLSSSSNIATVQITDPAPTDWTLTRAMRTTRFWMLCLTSFCLFGLGEHIVIAHHVAFSIDAGYSGIYAASVLALFGVMFTCGSFAGLVSDWIGREITLTLGTLSCISAIAVIMLMGDTSQPWMLYYYAIAFGFGIGVSAPTIVASVTDIFQGPKAGALIGFVWSSFAVGGAIGPWLGGFIFESYHSYLPAFILAIASFAIAGVAIWLAAPRKVRPVPGYARMRAWRAKPEGSHS
ncbi:MFS transporter [Chloroflexota bacterium]